MAALAYNSIYGAADPNDMSGGYSTNVQQAAVNQQATGQAAPTGMVTPTGAPAPTVNGPPVGPNGKTAFFGEGGIASTALGAIQVLGSLWSSFQQNKLAKESFKFEKEAYYTNLENQEKSYNTALEDKIATRYQGSGGSVADRDAEIARKSL